MRTLLPLRTCCFLSLALPPACGAEDPDDPTAPDAEDEDEDQELRVPLTPPPDGEGFQVDEGEFSVDANREAFLCVRLPIPDRYGDGPLYFRGIEAQLPLYTHHFFMSYSEEALPPGPCWGDDPLRYGEDFDDSEAKHPSDGGKLLFIAGEGETEYFLPEGYALQMATGSGTLTTSHHLLNFSDEPAQGYGTFNIYTTPEAEVEHPMNILNCLNRGIEIPPGEEGEVTGTCVVPFDLDLVLLSSHAHQFLKLFEARLFDGERTVPEPFYTSDDWDSPKLDARQEPIALKAGQGITYTCHFFNHTDQTITFGAGEAEEMCAVMNAYAYPPDRPRELPPSLGTINGDPIYCGLLGERCCDEDICELVDTSEFSDPF